MMSTCKTYNSLTSFTGAYLVKADNCVASKQASKQVDSKPIRESAESPCVVSNADTAHGLFAFQAQKLDFLDSL